MERIEGDLSRRGFVGAAFAGAMGIAAASVLSGCSAGGSSAADGDWTETFDVVVVGSGAGGHAAAIEAAKARGAESQWGGIIPPVCPTPVHDGDGVKQDGTEFGPECKGHWVMTAGAKADYPIEIVDRHLNKILDPTQIYSGMYANVCVNMYPYLYNGKKGIGCGLGPVQKTADGEAFGGGAPTAASVFTSMAANTQRINPLTGKPM